MQRHLEVAAFQTNPMSILVVPDVVVGSVMEDDSNEVPHVIAFVAVGMMYIHSFWPSVGVPVRFVVNEVIATA